EILSPALKVPDDLFSDTSDVSPFATYAPSDSAYLLVCKDWLRVATPLLYSVVVLRSKAQANALQLKVFRTNPSSAGPRGIGKRKEDDIRRCGTRSSRRLPVSRI
ncbi:hypothetical protein R3P38DRAFT_2502946, partial [Favolaschia claudopus]